MYTFNYWNIFLFIAYICLFSEFIKVWTNLDKWQFIYKSERHSIQHIGYLAIYLIAITIHFICEIFGIKSYFFEFMLWISGILLWMHIRNERMGE